MIQRQQKCCRYMTAPVIVGYNNYTKVYFKEAKPKECFAMGKFDKVIEATKPIAKGTAKKAAPLVVDAAQKTAPMIANVAKKSAPVIVGAAKITGRATVKAGSAAVAQQKIMREEKNLTLIEKFKQKYPECLILLSKYNPTGKMGHQKLNNWLCAFEIYDEGHIPQYHIVGNMDSEYAKRRLILNGSGRNTLGTVVEHGLLKTHVSVRYGLNHFTDVKYRSGYYYFSDSKYYCGGKRFTSKPSLCCDGRVLMERGRVKGHEVLVIVDPTRTEECLLIYAAMQLATYPRPNHGGGGE